MRAHHPELTTGKTDAQILAMRSNDALSNQAALDYAHDNAPQIAAAGFPVNATTLKLAHAFGPDGAVRVMQAPEGTPMRQIVPPEVLTANPQLAGMTNSTVLGQVAARFGVGPVTGIGAAPAPLAAVAPAAPAAPPAGPAGPPTGGATVAQLPGGGATVNANLTPGAVETQQQLAQRQQKYEGDLLTASQAAQRSNALYDQMRLESQSWTQGKFADVKMDALKTLDSLAQNVNAAAGTQVFTPNQSVGDWESFNKDAMQGVREAVRATSARAAVQEFNLISRALPADTTSPQAFHQLMDQMQGINDWTQAKSYAAAQQTGDPNAFDYQWNQSISPMTFIVHRMNTPDAKALHDNLVKSPEGQQLWTDVVQQMNFLDRGGFFRPGNVGLPTGQRAQ